MRPWVRPSAPTRTPRPQLQRCSPSCGSATLSWVCAGFCCRCAFSGAGARRLSGDSFVSGGGADGSGAGTLVNLETYFWCGDATQDLRAIGEGRADGHPARAGGADPAADRRLRLELRRRQRQRVTAGKAAHTYAHAGHRDVSVTLTWTADYAVGGGRSRRSATPPRPPARPAPCPYARPRQSSCTDRQTVGQSRTARSGVQPVGDDPVRDGHRRRQPGRTRPGPDLRRG